MDLDDLKALIRLMDEHELTELELDSDGRRVRLIKGGQQPAPPQTVVTFPTSLPAGGPALGPAAPPAAAASEGLQAIASPMVGTFYRSTSPDAEPLVDVGDQVHADSTLCIIEAMKVMNEIKAECEGVVKEILVGNGESVEYGQILFRVQPARG